MWLLTTILLFIIASICAAGHGDWSGMAVIGKVLVIFGVMALAALWATYPSFFVVCVVIFVVILIIVCRK